MSTHDETRKQQALDTATRTYKTLQEERDALVESIRGLQSTDDPDLLPLHDELLQRLKDVELKLKNAV